MNYLWILLLVAAVLLLAVVFLVRYWHSESEKTTRMISSQLRHFTSENRAIRSSVSREYSISDPEPFGSRVASLMEKLEESEQLTSQLSEIYSQLRQEMAAESLQRFLNLPLAPFNWNRIFKQAQLLKQKERSSSTVVKNARLYFQGLGKLGWEVADRARQVQRRVMDLGSNINLLSTRQVQGEVIESAVRKQTAILQALESIPKYLMDAEESEVVARADKHTIVQAYEVVSRQEPLLDELGPRVELWVEQHARADRDVRS